MSTPEQMPLDALTEDLASAYSRIRTTSLFICEPLQTEDYVVQSMPDVSPTKWHLAHTTWFFEQFLLKVFVPGYTPFDERFEFLFNSYYHSVGRMHARVERGLLTRPTVEEICRYRAHVDEHMHDLLLTKHDETMTARVTLGLQHEQQHQELMLTDIKHVFSVNPLLPTYRPTTLTSEQTSRTPLRFVNFDGGIGEIGHGDNTFCFDNEQPRHRVLLEPFALADRLITNREYLEFIEDGGYSRHELWLSDGWSTVQREQWQRPLYWSEDSKSEFTLSGPQPLEREQPVTHVSFYEADAFARWSGARLATEAEWEIAAATVPVRGNLLQSDRLHPHACEDVPGLKQMFGDVWEWTSSAYQPYPRYRPLSGALGEYNGKFMCNQLVLRGGSCVTSADHIRPTYRNFFYPSTRWQFAGIRLARDLP